MRIWYMVGLVLKVICKKNGSSKCIGRPRAKCLNIGQKRTWKIRKSIGARWKRRPPTLKFWQSHFFTPLVYILKYACPQQKLHVFWPTLIYIHCVLGNDKKKFGLKKFSCPPKLSFGHSPWLIVCIFAWQYYIIYIDQLWTNMYFIYEWSF